MENGKSLLDEVNLYSFDVDDDGLQARPTTGGSATSDLLIDWREPGHGGATGTKAFSCSEFEDTIFSADDIIRAYPGLSKSRSHSDNDNIPKLPPPPVSLPPRLAGEKKSPNFRISGAAVPPKLERKVPQLSEDATKVLNGYIFHENVASLINVDNGQKTNASNTSGNLVQDIDDNESCSSDEVFHLNKDARDDLIFRKPLLSSSTSSKKRVHFAKASNRVTFSSSPTMEVVDARIKKGRSWRSRLLCLSYVLLANILAGSLVSLVLYFSGALPIKRSQNGVCSQVVVDMYKNYTVNIEEPDFVLVAGHSRLIERKNGGRLFLVPYTEDCSECRPSGGIVAFNVETLELAWFAATEGQIESFLCADDLNGDQVSDCVFTTKQPVTTEIISGDDGLSISRVEENASPYRKMFAPVFIPDINGDFVPDLLLTIENTDPGRKQVDLVVLASDVTNGVDKVKYKRYLLFTLTNTTVQHPALLWRRGNDERWIVASFTHQSGLYLWTLRDATRARIEDRIIRFRSTLFGAPLGIFTELNGDSEPELVSCLQDGSVRAFGQNTVLWTYSPGKKIACVSNSFAVGRFLLKEPPGIVVSIKNLTDDSVNTIVLDGQTGQKAYDAVKSSSAFDSSPLVLSVSGALNQDQIVTWQVNNSKIQLISAGYPWKNQSILFQSEVVPTGKKVTTENDVYRLQVLNQRFTGSLFGSEGRVTLLFATNTKDKTIAVHKLILACKCHLKECGSFSDKQRWPSFWGADADGYLV